MGEFRYAESARLRAAHDHRKRVVESERRDYGEVKLFLVLLAHLVENNVRVPVWSLLQDCCEGGAGIFGIEIDTVRQHCLVSDIASCQIKSSLDLYVQFGFDVLCNQFCEDHLLAEVL